MSEEADHQAELDRLDRDVRHWDLAARTATAADALKKFPREVVASIYGEAVVARAEGRRPFEEFLDEIRRAPVAEFKPFAFYNVHGDMIEARWENVDEVAVWLNPQITLHVAADDRSKVVGVTVEGVSGLLPRGGAPAR